MHDFLAYTSDLSLVMSLLVMASIAPATAIAWRQEGRTDRVLMLTGMCALWAVFAARYLHREFGVWDEPTRVLASLIVPVAAVITIRWATRRRLGEWPWRMATAVCAAWLVVATLAALT